MIRQFLYAEANDINPGDPNTTNINLAECPIITSRIALYQSAIATFYAPSELAGTSGMHSEIIRANPNWRYEYPRFDTVLIQVNPDLPGIRGCKIGRVRAFLSVSYDGSRIPCALVQWFVIKGDRPSDVMNMWVVQPEMQGQHHFTSVVHIDSFIRGVHLIPVYNGVKMPRNFHFSYSLDAFKAFYLNRFADYHTHECIL